jgi:signal transduction histidine kinase/CheY-like chemotaxis protein
VGKAMTRLGAIYQLIRSNGTNNARDPFAMRSTIYLNMIWLASFITFLLFAAFVSLVQPKSQGTYFPPGLMFLFLFLLVFFLVRRGTISLAKHLFILTVYAAIAFSDHLFGKDAYTNLYYFAFLPTAFNIFSFQKQKNTMFFYLLLVPLLLVASELYTYQRFPAPAWALVIEEQVRVMNIFLGFALCVVYSGFMILNSGKKQNKLIIQSSALQTTLDNALGAIWTIDKNYTLIAVNKAFAGFAEKEFGVQDIKPGVNLYPLLNQVAVPEPLRQHYLQALAGERVLDEINFRNEIYEIRAEPLLDENNSIVGATFTSRIVTQIKKAQEQLLRAKKEAEEASDARTLFLSNMSHELRTPLNGIIGLTNIMLAENHLQEQKNNFELLGGLSDHMMLLINNILDYTKIEAGKATLDINRFNLKLFFYKLKLLFEPAAFAKKILFEILVSGNDDIYVKGDITRLNQVVMNLISNAIKFTHAGSVKLSVEIKSSTIGKGVAIEFRVADTGIGIHKDNLNKIFQSFTQADTRTTRRFGGTGLGLTIADSILSMMNSKLHVQSRLGEGSVFWFEIELPASSPYIVPSVPKLINEMEPIDNIHVLLAEDNPTNQFVARRILQKWKILTTVADNGKEALEAVKKNLFHLVLMDLDMPEMDGYESTAAIRQFNKDIPIVALTAASFDNMREVLIGKGFSDVIQKPFVPEDLYRKIKNLLA